jgi:hypothetical protein
MCLVCTCQLLVVAAKPRNVLAKQYAVHSELATSALLVHRYICSTRNATLRRTIQFWRQQAAQQLRHVLAVAAHRLSGQPRCRFRVMSITNSHKTIVSSFTINCGKRLAKNCWLTILLVKKFQFTSRSFYVRIKDSWSSVFQLL